MFLIKKPIDFKSVKELVRIYSIARKSHYEVLKLRRNCTDKEIKDAFIQMSKEYHPDKNKDARAQEMFVKIVEAYNVLGKPTSRAHYDHRTVISAHTSYNVYKNAYNVHQHATNPSNNYNYYQRTYEQASSQSSQEHTKKPDSEWYYGLKGIKKLPHLYIIGVCCAIASIGVILQVYLIRNLYMIQRRKAQERSKFLAEELNRVRTAARDNGNELQTRLLLDKIVVAANPTVTTASLGQALASDKKDTETLLTEFGVAEPPPDKWCNDSVNQEMKASNVNQSFLTW